MLNLFQLRNGAMTNEEKLAWYKKVLMYIVAAVIYIAIIATIFGKAGIIVVIITAIILLRKRKKTSTEEFEIRIPRSQSGIYVSENRSDVCVSDTPNKVVPVRNAILSKVLDRLAKPEPHQEITIIKLDTNGIIPQIRSMTIRSEEPSNDAAKIKFVDISKLFGGANEKNY